MSLYRKKPVVIEAVRIAEVLDQAKHDWTALPFWVTDALDEKRLALGGLGTLFVRTLEGEMLARRGDWLIRGVNGELYPVRDAIFQATYDPVEEAI